MDGGRDDLIKDTFGMNLFFGVSWYNEGKHLKPVFMNPDCFGRPYREIHAMAAWFSKVFKSKEAAPPPPEVGSNPPMPDWAYDEDEAEEVPRRIIDPPVIVEEEAMSGWSEEIRIKARLSSTESACIFMVDRPVLEGYSFWCPDLDTAYSSSPLADRLFQVGGVGTVLLHHMTVTVQGDGSGVHTWEEGAKLLGAAIREHLKSGKPVVHPEILEQMPSEEEIAKQIQKVIDEEINPGIAAHSGVITLNRVEGNTVFITMGGGCQGCAASAITLRQGIHQAFRAHVPEVGAILDETDHSAGENPFFKELPAGMGA